MRKTVDLKLATRLVNHGPVLLVSSKGQENTAITTIAWNMPIKKDPPMVAIEVGAKHYLRECIMSSGDLVINVPSRSQVNAVLKCGSVSGRDQDKAALCGLKMEGSVKVSSPRMADAPAVLECELVRDEHLIEKYNILPAKVVHAEVQEGLFTDHWRFSGDTRTLHHLGNKTFCVPSDEIVNDL